MGLEPTSNEFGCSNLLSYEAMISTRSYSRLCKAISSFVQCSSFISGIAFVNHHIRFNKNVAQVITGVQRNELMHILFTTEIFLEVATISWPVCDLNLRPLNYVQTL